MNETVLKLDIYVYTLSVQKVSRILNFRGLRIFDFKFFGSIMLVPIPLTYADKLAILNVHFNFDSYFARTCFVSSTIFAYFKKLIKESVSNFRGRTVNKEYYPQVVRNLREAIL